MLTIGIVTFEYLIHLLDDKNISLLSFILVVKKPRDYSERKTLDDKREPEYAVCMY